MAPTMECDMLLAICRLLIRRLSQTPALAGTAKQALA